MVYDLFPDTDGESSDALVPVVRLSSRTEEHDFPSRTTDGDMLSKAVEALRGSIIRRTKTLQPKASTGVNFADPANQKAITWSSRVHPLRHRRAS